MRLKWREKLHLHRYIDAQTKRTKSKGRGQGTDKIDTASVSEWVDDSGKRVGYGWMED